MSKTVIVMRHGKAERIAEGQQDIDRKLTKAGSRALKAALGDSVKLWPTKGKRTEVWTSPAVRAQETAKLLARALKKHGVTVKQKPKVVEELWSGDETALLEAVRASKADTIALVGHNPFSEELVTALTGADIRFATGALAAIELPCDHAPDARGASAPDGTPACRLLWFVQGPVSKRKEPPAGEHAEEPAGEQAGEPAGEPADVQAGEPAAHEEPADEEPDNGLTDEPTAEEPAFGAAANPTDSQPTSDPSANDQAAAQPIDEQEAESAGKRADANADNETLASMQDTIAAALETVQRRYDAFFEDPNDIETMHALRVSIRTARSLVAFIKPWQNDKQNSQMQNDLQGIVNLTSRQRELDVLWEQVQADESFPPELIDFCAALAARERTAVFEALDGQKTRKRLTRATQNAKAIKWNHHAEEGLDADEVRTRFDRLSNKLRANLESLDLSDVERTHDVRKQAKRIRYCADRFKDILGEDAPEIAKNMVAHQDKLGAICDARVNIDIINELTEYKLPESVAWELALLRVKYETFLFNALRSYKA